MTKWKIIIPVILVIIIAVVLGVTQSRQSANQKATNENQIENQLNLPQATGNPDDAASAILTFSNSEANSLNAENADTNLVTHDSQTINDFAQSYDENEF